MGLPTIEPYPMPTEADLPVNRVKWTCEPSRAVLLVHDMQNYFLRAFSPDASPVVELVRNIRALRDTCHALGVPVVYSAQPGGQSTEQRGLQLDMWGTGIGPDPVDAEIHAALEPGESDVRLTKWRYNAFHRTDLRSLLDTTGRDQLVVTGIYAHIGCLMTAADAFMQDIQAFFVADAVADFTPDDHHMAVRYAAGRCAVTTTTTRLITELNGAS
ncbi:isochorismatase family protein [Actinosynnema sp. NPDC047251]|uniref:Isochorismatase n=1 Tax=Saccharothrix espanaensis (strain ATCC 51144 / DSM 44229 / JCM 9112 / NBRC 15066 / NRRL 15764) TaxID=1179773 RepID=K0JZB6_SACES|nr:isochorismatase family protein [Saccharothrix espanaensis]CCH30014.1 Isochorismatase [Saccharothrix espanaensis DSM 44229]